MTQQRGEQGWQGVLSVSQLLHSNLSTFDWVALEDFDLRITAEAKVTRH
jgi:hypothetical protein